MTIMRPVVILVIFLMNVSGLKGQTTVISETTNERISATGLEWREHGNTNTYDSDNTMIATRRSLWESITRKFQEWESTRMPYLGKDRSISPNELRHKTNISMDMMDNITQAFQEWVTRGMSHPEMNHSPDWTTHTSNGITDSAQHSWENRTRNFQQWAITSSSHLEMNLSSEEMSTSGSYRENTTATAYGQDNEMRYMQNSTYGEEALSEVYSRSPSNASEYQSDRWVNDSLSVGNMNSSVRHYLEQVTRLPEWFENNTMNKWDNKTRQALVTKGYFSNGSVSDVGAQTSQLWNMSVQDVTRYPDAISNTTSMGSIEINSTGQIQTTVLKQTMNTTMYSNNSYTSQVDIGNMTTSRSRYDIPEITSHQSDNSGSMVNDTSAHISVTSGGMKDTSVSDDGRLGINESLTRREDNWNMTGSPPSTTSTPVVTPDQNNNSESTINDTSEHRNRTRSCLTRNNLTKDCLVVDSGEWTDGLSD